MTEYKKLTVTKKHGIDDLVSHYPYTEDEWNSRYNGQFGITEERYLVDMQGYRKLVDEHNENYIAELKEKGEYGKEYPINFNFAYLPEFDDTKPDYYKWTMAVPLGNMKDAPEKITYSKPETKMYQVWTQGYRATGEHGTATYHGECYAENFVEACKRILGHDKSFEVREPIEVTSESARLGMARMGINQETVCFLWVCRCFDNEADARKSFG